ncbi:phosphotransferase [Micromonospora sp. NPDC007271]|uniref:phosphotransferase n=1 Tax=Micromonospora sp. NPDC007271 TaxID=3154587 RepID=UPI0033D45441
MSPAGFVKRYADPARGVAAQAHLRWLQQLGSDVRLPHLHPGTATHLILEHLDGTPPQPRDLPRLAAVLGRLHGTAYARELHAAHLDRPFHSQAGPILPAFHTGRHTVLAQVGVDPTGLPAAFYKDANLRNFIITDTGPAVVDFDDLTLAPFGYDLAKLIVSAAMTYGTLDSHQAEVVVAAYTHHVEITGGPTNSCTFAQLTRYAEMHHLLTARYLHRNGYRHPWPAVRPWPASAGPLSLKEPPP